MIRTAGLALVASLSAAAAAAQDRPALELTAGADWSVGDYGAADDTEVLYAPLTARARAARWRVEATIPYLSIEGPGSSVAGVGAPIFVPPGAVSRRSGLGDVIVGAGWTMQPAAEGRPSLEVFGSVKLPTADADEGLGTGETDLALLLNLTHQVSPAMQLVAGVGYEWLGDPALYDLEDGFTGYAGLSYAATENVSVGGSLNYRHSYAAGYDEQVTVTPWAAWRAPGGRWGVSGYGTVGLTDASPDYGLGFQVTLYR